MIVANNLFHYIAYIYIYAVTLWPYEEGKPLISMQGPNYQLLNADQWWSPVVRAHVKKGTHPCKKLYMTVYNV